MPGNCEAVGCANHTLMSGKKPSFHRFPKDPERRKRWTIALKKLNRDGSEWQPSANARICGDHFIGGKPNHEDRTHPDYTPSIFKHNPDNYPDNPSKCHVDPKTTSEHDQEEICAADALLDLSTPGTSQINKDDSPAPSLATPVTPSERTMFYDEINALRTERDAALHKLKEAEEKLEKVSFTAGSVQDNDVKSKYSTGLSWPVFFTTFNFLLPFMASARQHKNVMSPIDQFFVTLVKLRTGVTFDFLSTHTGISKTCLIEIFWKWINIMYVNLAFLIRTPDPDAVHKTLPHVFKKVFPRLTCIVDCFKIFIDQAKKLKARAQTYSNYKKHNTVKVFIGCTPLGSISFISTAWEGRVSDVELIRKSGFINSNFHSPGDQILADRGFPVQEDLAVEAGAHLIIPAFTRGKTQLSAKEVEVSRRLASVQIHIERVIGVLKNRYTILQGPLPISLIKSLKDESMDLQLASIDKIVTVCASLVNLGDSIVYKCSDN